MVEMWQSMPERRRAVQRAQNLRRPEAPAKGRPRRMVASRVGPPT